MLLISDVVREQLNYAKLTSLPESIGDGYLYTENPIFRRLRSEANRLGVRFSYRAGILDYYTCPNIALKEIIKKRIVPYQRNAKPLVRMAKMLPTLELERALEIKKNNIMHESAHLVAHYHFQIEGPLTSTKGQRDHVMGALLSESFATGCETAGQFYSKNSLHDWMYRHNTNVYGCHRPEYRKLLEQIVDGFGIDVAFRLSVLSFLCWNFFYPTMDAETLKAAAPLYSPKTKVLSKDISRILSFCNFHFSVHGWFRNQVADFYFRSLGLKQPLGELLRFNCISYLVENEFWLKRFDSLMKTIASTKAF